ncbi:flagellar assembly protein FliW [Fervidobacterium thailandense]|uniref:Flagellar assembly factor FliW n=1 Tax=Fervidobacterium thailandense TaxID=1008305 RepID=A0A1E3G568_9BACT|nr:flagellar assembly protein FliW [Fervidobacterium thailandense]ODN31446.1 flagellar assembly protein FliW [Fervidobacterium thailandense]
MIFSTKLGKFELQENEIVTFPNGIPGFEHLRKFSVISLNETNPICWLVSLEDDSVALPVIDPWLIIEDYEVNLSEEDVKVLDVQDPSDLVVWAVVTIPPGAPEQATVNLKAPIVINLRNGTGVQVIMDRYELKHPIKGS